MAQYIVRMTNGEFVHYWSTNLPVGGAPRAHRDEASRYDHRAAQQIADELRMDTEWRVTVVRD